MKKKINVCLLFGGKSGEHEVSLQSAKSIFESLDKKKYNVHLVGIDKNGRWLLSNASNYLLNSNNPKLIALNKTNSTEITALHRKDNAELVNIKGGTTHGLIDVFFPVMHGTYGEDGSMQGLLEILDVAYVGAGVLGSALGMDKDVMKRLLKEAGLPVTRFVALRHSDKIKQPFSYPVFVKPANLGSSVGVTKVHNRDELENAVNEAFKYDTKILVEEAVEGREVECSVLGNDNPIASIPGEVIPTHEFYSYEAKYIDENGASLIIPANLSDELVKETQKLAVAAFKTLEVSGMARVDFFLRKNGKLLINEINTIPGFTKISMYPKLWEASGIPYYKLLDKLIELALEKKKEKDSLIRNYSPK